MNVYTDTPNMTATITAVLRWVSTNGNNVDTYWSGSAWGAVASASGIACLHDLVLDRWYCTFPGTSPGTYEAYFQKDGVTYQTVTVVYKDTVPALDPSGSSI